MMNDAIKFAIVAALLLMLKSSHKKSKIPTSKPKPAT